MTGFKGKIGFQNAKYSAKTIFPVASGITGSFGPTLAYKQFYVLAPTFGYAFENTLVYADVGVSLNRVNAQLNSSLSRNNQHIPLNGKTKQSRTVPGLYTALGVQHKLSDNVHVFAETSYNTIANRTFCDRRITGKRNVVMGMVGVAYQFGAKK